MGSKRKRGNSLSLVFFLLGVVVSHNMFIPVLCTDEDSLTDMKNYYPPGSSHDSGTPHHGHKKKSPSKDCSTPPSGSNGTPLPGGGSPGGSYHSPPNGGQPGGGHSLTPPSSGGGYYNSPPTGGEPGSGSHTPPSSGGGYYNSPPTGGAPGGGSHTLPPSGGGYYNSPPTGGSLTPPSSGGGYYSPPTGGLPGGGSFTPPSSGGGYYNSPPTSGEPGGGSFTPPSSGGGYYNSPPSGIGPGSGFPSYSPPITGGSGGLGPFLPTPTTPIFPVDPNIGSPFGTCSWWMAHPHAIWGVLGYFGTVGGIFGAICTPIFGHDLSLSQALANTRPDGLGALFREGSASLLNSMASQRFPFTTEEVTNRFTMALYSVDAAAAQADIFRQANEGRLRPRE